MFAFVREQPAKVGAFLGALRNHIRELDMCLTDIVVRSTKPRERAYKLTDGGGLYLLVTPAGGRLWRLKYRADGVERKLSLGKYPAVTLADARKARDSARAKLSAGDDPAAAKRRERVAKRLAVRTIFGAVSLEYIEKAEREGRSPATIAKLRWARDWLSPAVGRRPVDQIEPHELLAVLKRQEAAGNLETARRTRAFASRVFRFAVATARAKTDPAALLIGAVAAPRPKHLAAILDAKRAGELLRAIDVRAMASTLLNESGKWSPDAIERALAHKDNDQVRGAYHRGAHWAERVAMAQWWGDHLDALRAGGEVIPLRAVNVA